MQPQQKTPDVQQQSKRLSEDQQQQYSGFRGTNNNNRIYPQEDVTSDTSGQHHPYHPPPAISSTTATPTGQGGCPEIDDGGNPIISTITSALEELSSCSNDGGSSGNGKGLLSPLRERLAAIEELTTSLQSWQVTEKTEYEKCVSDLANQVSRAVALQQLMKSEVEKLQQRVVDLENHNKAMATMIIPTLVSIKFYILKV